MSYYEPMTISYRDAHSGQYTPLPTPLFSSNDSTWFGPIQSQRQYGTITPTSRMLKLSMRQQPMNALAVAKENLERRLPIDPPPIVRLLNKDGNNPDKHHLISPYLFVIASLIPEGTDTVTAAAQRSLIGERCSSIYCLKDGDNKDGGYFIFGDISVQKSGKYRLHFSLFNSEPRLHYSCIAEIVSGYFTVYQSNFPGMQESTALSRSFAEQGVHLRMRQGPRGRQLHESMVSSQDHEANGRKTKRQKKDELEHRTPPPSQIPSMPYDASQYAPTFYGGLDLSAQSYLWWQSMEPASTFSHGLHDSPDSIDPAILNQFGYRPGM